MASPQILQRTPGRTRELFPIAAHYALSQNYGAIDLGSMRAAIAYGEKVVESTDLVGEMLSDDPVLRRVWRLRDFVSSRTRATRCPSPN